jgi:glycosyltransferase involved in cell wall biosynthesis
MHEGLLAAGIPSKIFTETLDGATKDLTSPYLFFDEIAGKTTNDDLFIYQAATASRIPEWLLGRDERLVVNYHNVTPSTFFERWDNRLSRHQARAKQEIASLAARAILGLTVSEFNADDLKRFGYEHCEVIPPMWASTKQSDDERAKRKNRRGRSIERWLAVGRLAPNKAIEDILFSVYSNGQLTDQAVHLDICGGFAVPSYVDALMQLSKELGLGDMVTFFGKVDDDVLDDRFARADVLVVGSLHEGFCVPAVEAMGRGLPVVDRDAGALKETLGGTGMIVDNESPQSLAEGIDALRHESDDAYDSLVSAQMGRATALSPNKALVDTIACLRGLLET